MNLQTIEIPRARAREQAAEYRRAAKTITDPARRAEFEEIARAYRLAARDETPLIALTPTITAGGTVTRTRVSGRGDSEYRKHYLLPRLAVCRASASFTYTSGVQTSGSIEFADSLRRRFDYRSGVIELDTSFELPQEYSPGRSGTASGRHAWRAMVPIVPPKHRPARAGNLSSFLVLWEVDAWEWEKVPAPPGDPALLRHVGGDIYAVLAVWDLTDLERLVLTGRRPA